MREETFNREKLVPQLRKTRLFRYLTEEQIGRVTENARFYSFNDEERVIEENSTDDALYVVLKGFVVVRVRGTDEDVYICTLGAGEIFGEAGVFINVKRTASVVVQDSATLMRIDRRSFMRALNDNPQAGIKILLMMVYSLLRKLREVNAELAFERRGDEDQANVDAMIEEMMPTDAKDVLD